MEPQEAHDADVTFIDVREPYEWSAGHIQGASHVPMGQIVQRAGEFDPSTPYVAVCRSGNRSAQVTDFLRQRGLDIENLEGGMKAWRDAGLPMVSENGEASPAVV